MTKIMTSQKNQKNNIEALHRSSRYANNNNNNINSVMLCENDTGFKGMRLIFYQMHNYYDIVRRTFPFLSTMGFIEELSFSSVFFTRSAVSLTALSWCQHSVVVRRIRRRLCNGVCVCVGGDEGRRRGDGGKRS